MCHFSLHCDVYEYGKLGISVNTSPIMALLILFSKVAFTVCVFLVFYNFFYSCLCWHFGFRQLILSHSPNFWRVSTLTWYLSFQKFWAFLHYQLTFDAFSKIAVKVAKIIIIIILQKKVEYWQKTQWDLLHFYGK